MKESFVVTQRYTVLKETENKWPVLKRPTRQHVMFLRKYKDKQFFFFILIDGVFVTRLCLVVRESRFDELCGFRQNCRFTSAYLSDRRER